jgi:cell division protein FtsB
MFISIWKNTKLRVFLIITSVALYAFLFSETSVRRRLNMEEEKEALQRTLEKEQILQQLLKDSIARFKNNDPLLIEKKAREQFNMSKKGETIYKIVRK